jgi:hypothetical protein
MAEPVHPDATQIAPTLMGAALRLGLSPQEAGGDGGAVSGTLLAAIELVLNSRGNPFRPSRLPELDRRGRSEFARLKDCLQSQIDGSENAGLAIRKIEEALRMAFALRALGQPASVFWIKVLEMLNQNWAIIEDQGPRTIVVFCGDDGGVFDELEFDSRPAAEAALSRNGFVRFDPPRDIPRHPAGALFLVKVENNGVYSSGRFWRN